MVFEPTETVKEVVLPMAMVARPAVRPAGMVATDGWVVTAAGRADWAVTTVGMPVTTPRLLVWVR